MSSPAFTIRDGVFYVRDWEWSTESATLLGIPFTTHFWRECGVGVAAVELHLANGYQVTISIYADEPEHCYAFFWTPDGGMDWSHYHANGDDRCTAARLLAMVVDAASRGMERAA